MATTNTAKKKTTTKRARKAAKKTTTKRERGATPERGASIPDDEMIAFQVSALKRSPNVTKAALMLEFRGKGRGFQNHHFGILLKKARVIAAKAAKPKKAPKKK